MCNFSFLSVNVSRYTEYYIGDGLRLIVPSKYGVRGGQDRRARVQRGLDTGLGDGNGLLLHGLMDGDLGG